MRDYHPGPLYQPSCLVVDITVQIVSSLAQYWNVDIIEDCGNGSIQSLGIKGQELQNNIIICNKMKR